MDGDCQCAAQSRWRADERLGMSVPRNCQFAATASRRIVQLILLLTVLCMTAPVYATIHYSGERYAELPSSWKGFLADHRALRVAGIPVSAKTPPSLLRLEYQAALNRLVADRKQRALKAAELADMGALYLRLGQVDSALDVLRPAAVQYPLEFAIQANLGSAWQLAGQWEAAVEHLRQAVQLAPGEHKALEQLHLKLALARSKSTRSSGLDNLFGISFMSVDGKHRLGKLDRAEKGKLPANMVALTQRLALSFPQDARLLWQLGEQSVVYGDLNAAAMLFEQCVGEYGLDQPQLRAARQAVLAVQGADQPLTQTRAEEAHSGHGSGVRLEYRSRKPLIQQPFDAGKLTASGSGQPSLIVWPILAETAADSRRFHPTFHPYLKKLENKPVSLTGFLHPLTDDLDCTSFILVEYPIGCWYCTAPDLTGIVFVSMKPGSTAKFTRDVIQVTGTWKLNSSDPEEFLFSITDAAVNQAK